MKTMLFVVCLLAFQASAASAETPRSTFTPVGDRLVDAKLDELKAMLPADTGITIGKWRWLNDSTDSIIVEGVAKNESLSDYRSGQIHITAEDSTGKFLGTGMSFLAVRPLSPGESSPFKVYISNARCGTKQLSATFSFSKD